MKRLAPLVLMLLLCVPPAWAQHKMPDQKSGVSAQLKWPACKVNGAVPIGATGGLMKCGTITAGTNITVTNAANGVTVASAGAVINSQAGTPLATQTGSGAAGTMYTFTLTGGTLGTTGAVHCHFTGDFTNSVDASSTMTYTFTYNTTSLVATTSTMGNNANGRYVQLDYYLQATGATNSQVMGVYGLVSAANAISGTAVTSTAPISVEGSGTAAVDSTTNQTLLLKEANSTTNSTFHLTGGYCSNA